MQVYAHSADQNYQTLQIQKERGHWHLRSNFLLKYIYIITRVNYVVLIFSSDCREAELPLGQVQPELEIGNTTYAASKAGCHSPNNIFLQSSEERVLSDVSSKQRTVSGQYDKLRIIRGAHSVATSSKIRCASTEQ